MNETINEKNLSERILDLQHELLRYAQARQMLLVSSCDSLEEILRFFQTNHQRQVERILNCAVF